MFPGIPHHVTQRGNRRGDVFFEHGDGLAYLQLLNEHTRRNNVEVVAYSLMPNHVHLVVIPAATDGLHRTLKAVHGRYAQRINRMRGQVGHVWQNRYFSSPLDPRYFVNAVRYVELNPVRANLVAKAADYAWSSAATHCGIRPDTLVGPRPRSSLFSGINDWSEWLARGLRPSELEALRKNGRQNIPCGSESFVAELEKIAARTLQHRRPGRPSKDATEKGDAHLLEKVNVPF